MSMELSLETSTRHGREPRLVRTRTVAIRVVYAVLSVWAVVMSGFGWAVVVSGQLPDSSWRFAATATLAFKALTLGSVVVVAWTGGRSVLAVRALVAGQLCWALASVIAPQDDATVLVRLTQVAVSAAIWVGPWLLLASRRSRLWREPVQVDRLLVPAATIAAVPLVTWAVLQAGLDIGGAHVAQQAELRFDLVGVPLALAAAALLGAVHPRGWWRVSVAAAGLYVGLLALVLSGDWGSPGRLGGLALVLAVGVAVASVRARAVR